MSMKTIDNMMKHVRDTLYAYKATAEGYIEAYDNRPIGFRVSLETGSNEGYYVTVYHDVASISCRYHSRDEAVKALGVLLTLVPNN